MKASMTRSVLLSLSLAAGLLVITLPSGWSDSAVAAAPEIRAALAAPPAVPAPVRREPAKVTVVLETQEVRGVLADGVEYTFWTFNGTVPGPMLRVRVGDDVELQLRNNKNSKQIHSIDLHAVNGPGGGATLTQTAPGEQTAFRFKALNPGLYVYHCASPHIPTHIANGMYGLILVERPAVSPRWTESTTSCRASSTPGGRSAKRASRRTIRARGGSRSLTTWCSTERWGR